VFTLYCLLQIVCDFDWEMDDYEVCMDIVLFGVMFLSLHLQDHL
jgi:hypothetical protein